ncbi:MAG: alpha/beta fold hydrolase [Rhodobacteraceae bacterium]|nr:alpha/beta fold hydrolase [Paracoccaceae bacterium]
MNTLLKLLLGVAVLYAGIVALLAVLQTALIFPRWAMSGAVSALPAEARMLEVTRPDGVRLFGIDLPGVDPDLPVVLGFGGNAWPAEALALFLRGQLPGHRVVVFHYRGYGPSGGRPSAAALLADAVAVHDALEAEAVVAVGLSLGAGPAAHLAAERTLAGLVLVTPFDSMHALAQGHYPWVPVRWLLRHRMEVAAALARVSAPVAIIAAGRDTIIPPERTAPLRVVAPQLVLDAVVEGAGHNDLYDRPAFTTALRRALDEIAAAR